MEILFRDRPGNRLSSLPSSPPNLGLKRHAAGLACSLIACFGLVACDAPLSSGAGASEVSAQMAFASADPAQAEIDLGRRLLFDGRLSRPRGVSCAMCHDPFLGWGDDRPQGKGVQDNTLAGDLTGDGQDDHNADVAVSGNRFKTVLTPRNTPTIYNSHLFPSLFWDGRAGDLVHQAQFPFEAGSEMNSSWDEHILPLIQEDPAYIEGFEAAYGRKPSQDLAVRAIGAYESTISVFDTPYDKFLAGDTGALTGQELDGHDLFFGKAGCSQCHPGPLLTNFEFANTGVPSAGIHALNGTVDLGRGQFTDLTRTPAVDVDNPLDYAKFKTPQLRMVSVTGPYMHNGAFESLEEVVEFYDQGGGPDLSGTGTKDSRIVPLGLTPAERAALVAFLENSLTGTPIQ